LSSLAKAAPHIARQMDELDWKQIEILLQNCGNAKFFDGDLFDVLTKRVLYDIKRNLKASRAVMPVQVLYDLNALNDDAKSQCHAFFLREKTDLDNGCMGILRRIFGKEFSVAKEGSSAAVCPAFWRGQCKWGPRCNLSHEEGEFERTVKKGKWKKPQGESRGMQQSMDLNAADRIGRMW